MRGLNMRVFETDKVRNVAVLGHAGCGKTTLVEAMAYVTGVVSRQGRVEDGNTISDFDKEEQKRLCSLGTTIVPIEYDDIKINFLDTPGAFDYVGEVEEALSAAGAAIIVISGKAGIEAGTDFVMVSHISLPSITGDNTPCCLIPTVVTDLLRSELGYGGVIITDAMNMKAVSEYYSSDEAAIKALKAGCDMILMPENFEEAYNGIIKAVREDQTLDEKRIDDALKRIYKVKYKAQIAEELANY